VSEGDVRDISQLVSPAPKIVPLAGTTMDGGVGRHRQCGPRRSASSSNAATLLEVDQHAPVARASGAQARTCAVGRVSPSIEWLDPLFSAGHWTPNVFVALAASMRLRKPGAHSVRMTVEQSCATLRPNLLLFAPCGFDVERAEREAICAARDRRLVVGARHRGMAIDGNALTSRPGPRLADAVEVIAAIIAPTLFPAPPAHYARKLR
jgi:iron complex transport system substrate-binding protein